MRAFLVAPLVMLGALSSPAAPPRHAPVPAVARTTTAPPLVVIVLENHEYASIVGSTSARYLGRRFIPSGTLFTNYHAVEHPSLPNYLDMTSGTDSGCHDDLCPRRSYGTNNIFSQLTSAGVDWRAWMGSMPSRCALSSSGRYAVKHNPAPYYSNLFPHTCRAHDVKYPKALPTLAPFTFITPNICDDMHDCSVNHGDHWLRNEVPDLLAAGAVVVITFDEGSSNEGGGGHIMTAVSGPGVEAGAKNRRAFDHFGLLAGIEDWFGVNRLHHAKTHRPLPLT
jgi:hypothetical protein